jgi:hypothetical protein
LFSFYVNPLWGTFVGAIWLLSRIAYAWGYYQAAEKRIDWLCHQLFAQYSATVGFTAWHHLVFSAAINYLHSGERAIALCC